MRQPKKMQKDVNSFIAGETSTEANLTKKRKSTPLYLSDQEKQEFSEKAQSLGLTLNAFARFAMKKMCDE